MENDINSKIKRVNLLKILNLGLAMLFTMGGSVSLVFLLMYLNEVYNVSFLSCFIIESILLNIYSLIVNSLLAPIDGKIRKVKNEIELLENENIKQNMFIDNNIKKRFDSLSRNNRIKILNFIKDNLEYVDGIDDVSKLTFDKMYLIMKEMDSIEEEVVLISDYTRKKLVDRK